MTEVIDIPKTLRDLADTIEKGSCKVASFSYQREPLIDPAHGKKVPNFQMLIE